MRRIGKKGAKMSEKEAKMMENGGRMTENEQKATKNGDKSSIGEKIAKLDALAEWFYSEDFKLEEATERYREAIGVAQEIEEDLAELKNEIEVLAEDFSK